MSTDFEAVCDACRLRCHVGQIMVDRASFGYGSTDGIGISYAAAFVMKHAECDLALHTSDGTPVRRYERRGLRVIVADREWTDVSDKYAVEEYG